MKEVKLQDIELLNRLRLDIERAWNDSHDEGVVHRLAREHPDLSARLYEFFADIVAMSLAPDDSQPQFQAADDRILAWLESEGFRKIAQARRAANQSITPTSTAPHRGRPENLVVFLKLKTHEDIDSVAWALEITPRFLLDLSNHPSIVPEKARLELAERAEQKWSVAKLETLEVFDQPSPQLSMRRAASRSKPFTSHIVSFKVVVGRSGLDDKQKAYWLSLV